VGTGRSRRQVGGFVLGILVAGAARSQELALEELAVGVPQVVAISHAGDGSGRLFFVQQTGRILVFRNGSVLPTPFLDVRALVLAAGEQGLLGLAFDPSYSTNRRFFVHYNNTAGQSVLARYQVSAGNPDVADPSSAQILLTVDQPFANHKGGQLAFGPDGYLYMSLGDGGSGGDPGNRAQNLGTLLGKILRLDVSGNGPYAIPASNPFAATAGARGEIWAYGLRNPWRFSFDRATGDMFIGDVGQNAWEEIDFEPAGSGGRNYGWRLMEGNHCFNPPTGCDTGSLTRPILEYPHSGADCSVTGGYRYRGSDHADLAGMYLYADFCSGRLWGGVESGGGWTARELMDSPLNISTFGEDQRGELYLAHYNDAGAFRAGVYRIRTLRQPPLSVPADFDGDSRSDLLWRHTGSGETYGWRMEGLAIGGQGRLGTVADPDWVIRGIGDLDGDGKSDILWYHNRTTVVYAWLMSAFTPAAMAAVGVGGDDRWQIEGMGDLDGDEKADVLWRHTASGDVHAWLMDGMAVKSAGAIGRVGDLGWRIESLADLDGDGRADVVWRHERTASVYAWLMNGLAIASLREIDVVADPGWRVQGTGDLNGDGKADIVWRNATTGELYGWLMDGAGKASEGSIGRVADLAWRVRAIGDYDGDGRSDLLWRHEASGTVYQWRMGGLAVLSQGEVARVADLGWQLVSPRR
jgi:hypothetical protein